MGSKKRISLAHLLGTNKDITEVSPSPPFPTMLTSTEVQATRRVKIFEALTSAILIAVLGLPSLDGIPKAPSHPYPPWKGPGFEILFSLPSPVSPKENAARGKMEERLAMREKRRAKKEEGGFPTEY